MRRRWKIAVGSLIPLILCVFYIGNAMSEAYAQGESFFPPEYLLNIYLTLGIIGPNDTDKGETSLSWAAGVDGGYSAKLVEVLLAHGAQVNGRDQGGGTPLMSAAVWGDEDTMSVLLAHGADPNLEDEDGETALFHLPYPGAHGAARLLLAAGADPCHRDHEGKLARDRYRPDPELFAVFPECPPEAPSSDPRRLERSVKRD
jgi:hypothetical protein